MENDQSRKNLFTLLRLSNLTLVALDWVPFLFWNDIPIKPWLNFLQFIYLFVFKISLFIVFHFCFFPVLFVLRIRLMIIFKVNNIHTILLFTLIFLFILDLRLFVRKLPWLINFWHFISSLCVNPFNHFVPLVKTLTILIFLIFHTFNLNKSFKNALSLRFQSLKFVLFYFTWNFFLLQTLNLRNRKVQVLHWHSQFLMILLWQQKLYISDHPEEMIQLLRHSWIQRDYTIYFWIQRSLELWKEKLNLALSLYIDIVNYCQHY